MGGSTTVMVSKKYLVSMIKTYEHLTILKSWTQSCGRKQRIVILLRLETTCHLVTTAFILSPLLFLEFLAVHSSCSLLMSRIYIMHHQIEAVTISESAIE